MLIGDRIENPGNVEALRRAAALFGRACAFHESGAAPAISLEELAKLEVIALENAPGAEEIYGFRASRDAVLVVGNERRGIGKDVLALARRVVKIPMSSRSLDTINVAAAAAVGLHYLEHPGGKQVVRADPSSLRPELLLVGGEDPVELGSALRSAAAFGWERVHVDDREGTWFLADRGTRSLARGAARRGRNTIRIVPGAPSSSETIVISPDDGEPLHRANLTGSEKLIAVGDPSLEGERVHVPGTDLRLVASIVLAEATRQVGVRKREGSRRPRFFLDLRLGFPSHAVLRTRAALHDSRNHAVVLVGAPVAGFDLDLATLELP